MASHGAVHVFLCMLNHLHVYTCLGIIHAFIIIRPCLCAQPHPGYVAESSTLLVSTSIVMTVTVILALVSVTALTASVIICCKRPHSKETTSEPNPVYYSSIAGGGHVTGPADPAYEVVSNVIKLAKNIDTEPNKAYHPVSVEPNEAYQINTSVTAS